MTFTKFSHICTVFRKTYRLERNQLSQIHGISRSNTKMIMEIKKNKRVLLKNVELDWLQIWMMAPSIDVKVEMTEIHSSLNYNFFVLKHPCRIHQLTCLLYCVSNVQMIK